MSSFFNNPKSLLLGLDDVMMNQNKEANKIADNVISSEENSMQDNLKDSALYNNINNNLSKKDSMEQLKASLLNCNKCKLAKYRTNIVFGYGNVDTTLMFIGEGPGAEEDKQGLPFVGRSGQLLTKMINAMGLTREDIYIANIVKCRPPENRDPFIEEAKACINYLRSQIQIIKPSVIVCLGSVSLNFLLQPDNKLKLNISKMRGQWQDFYGYKVLPTFHPAYLLRNPSKKVDAWNDLQLVMTELGLKLPNK